MTEQNTSVNIIQVQAPLIRFIQLSNHPPYETVTFYQLSTSGSNEFSASSENPANTSIYHDGQTIIIKQTSFQEITLESWIVIHHYNLYEFLTPYSPFRCLKYKNVLGETDSIAPMFVDDNL